jgi:hypothetical protein
MTIGIAAYESVISDPGTEIVGDGVNSIILETPAKTEFGRFSKMRQGDPHLYR